ncbi:MAG: lipoprotein [Burkholderiales bacterium]|nr:lipoprotein [Burkholderiales bacterium]
MRRLSAIFALVLLAACGYKGPLYLPSAKPAHTEPVPAVTPQPANPETNP